MERDVSLRSCGRRENLTLEVFDYDLLGSDDSLGKVRIALAQLVDDQEYTQWCLLGEDATNMGQLQVRYKVSPLADDDGELEELERSELEVKLYDWDMIGDNDEVGTATVAAGARPGKSTQVETRPTFACGTVEHTAAPQGHAR